MHPKVTFQIYFVLFVTFNACAVANNAGSPLYPSYDFQSFNGKDLFSFKNSYASDFYERNTEITPICSDDELQISCFLAEWYNNVFHSYITCTSYTSAFYWGSYIKANSGPSRVAYNPQKYSLIFWDESGNLVSFNLQGKNYIFNTTLICDDDDYVTCSVTTSNLNNGDYFYSYKLVYDSLSFTNYPVLEVRNSTSGASLKSLDITVNYLYDIGNNIAIGFVQFEDDTEGFSILDPITLDYVCNASIPTTDVLNGFHSNTKYINIDTYAPDLFTYDENCNALWRMPFYSITTIAAYDFVDNFYGFGYGYDIELQEYLQSIFQVPISSEAPNLEDIEYITFSTSFLLAGIDSTSTLFFANITDTDLQIYSISHDSWKNTSKPEYSMEIDGGFNVLYDEYFILNLISSGIQFYISSDFRGIVSVQSSANEWWDTTNVMSYILVPITFIFSIIIMIKHMLRGEDGKGWEKSKILDVINSILVCISIIFITLTICIAQVQLINDINDNTVAFSKDLGEFYETYLQSCGTTTSDALDLCTCDDTDSQYKSSSCRASSCPVDENTCFDYLEYTCDCYHSVYQWSCLNCDYLVNGSCTVDLQNLPSYTTLANEQWKDCQHYYDTPTLILNINFFVLIGSAIFLVILNIIQIVLAYDVVIFDLILTSSSLLLAFLQFLLILIGAVYVSLGQNGNCTSNVLDLLPGCIVKSSNVLDMEILASTYLNNAYTNLFTSPIIFLISALPDLLSLFCCMGVLQIYRYSKGYETIGTTKQSKISNILPLVCVAILFILAIIIFAIASILFFIWFFCNDSTDTCGIDPIILNWFFVIGIIPGSIIICCCCVIACFIGVAVTRN